MGRRLGRARVDQMVVIQKALRITVALLALLTLACSGKRTTGGLPAPPTAEAPRDVVVSVDMPETDTDDAASLVLDEDGTMVVGSVRRLLSAIRSNRTLQLRPGTYDFGDEPIAGTEHVRWGKVHDGHELIIENVENLTIVASRPSEPPRILARPRYAFVIKLVNVKNVTLEHLVLGHTPAGGCTGGVVGVENSQNVQISDSDLFGSGTVGVSLTDVEQFRFERSSIRECTYGIATVASSTDVLFSDSKFVDNAEYDLIDVTATPSVRFDRCVFRNNRTSKGYGYVFFKTDAKSSVTVNASKFESNVFDQITNDKRRLNVVGDKAKGWAHKQLNKPDPQLNQIYRLVRYRKWIVAGTQAGIVFWNPKTGTVDAWVKAYISSDLMVRGKYLWAGTYRSVMRFDGLKSKTYLRAQKGRGGSLVSGPKGELVVHQEKLVQQPNHWWQYDDKADRFTPMPVASAGAMPALLGGGAFTPHDVMVRKNGEIWGISFLRSLHRFKGGTETRLPIKGAKYPGHDPRELYEDPRGKLWSIDFDSGFLAYDDSSGAFVRHPIVGAKASEMVVDAKRGRTWFLHYTDGLHLVDGNKKRFFDLSRLQYMRALLLDRDGSVWVGGWNALVHIQRQGASGWREQSYVVSSATVPAGVGP